MNVPGGLKPRVIAVILNYRRSSETIDCVNSLLQSGYSNLEVLIVDNFSGDGSEEKFRERYPAMKIIQTGRNLGFTGGVNAGLSEALKAGATYILLLNEDTLVSANFLDPLVSALEEIQRAAAAGGTIYHHPDTSRVWFAGGQLVPWRGLAVHHVSRPPHFNGTTQAWRKVTFLTGCMTLIRVSHLHAIGLRDERFFMSLEDIEYSARILNKGYEQLYAPASVIYHRIPVTYESAFNLYYSVRNRLLLIDTAFGPVQKLIARWYFLVVILGKLAVWKFARPEYYKSAKFGLQDYFSQQFYEGRGVAEFAR
jgi:GT2 family glycosyltransferase